MRGVRLLGGVGLSIGLAWGCSLSDTFACSQSDECAGGVCQPTGFCSFPDPTCETGQRYGEFAGSLAGECVEDPGVASSGSSSSTTPEPSGGTQSEAESANDTDPTDTEAVGGSSTGAGPVCDWWDPSFQYRLRIDVDGLSGPVSVGDFPVLVALDPLRFDYSKARPDGDDVRFVGADDATEFAYDLESWTTGGTSWFWVSLPQLSDNEDFFFMYFGKESAVSASDDASVWANSYAAVYHLGMPPSDSAGINDGLQDGAVPDLGFVAAGYVFDGQANTHIDAGSDETIDNLFETGGTISAWIRPTDWGEGEWGRIVDKSNGTNAVNGFSFMLSGHGGTEWLEFRRHYAGIAWSSSPEGSITLDEWHFVAVTLDDTDEGAPPVLYIDGEQVAVEVHVPATSEPRSDADQPLWIGERAVLGNRTFEGTIDEVRLARAVRSAEWMQVQYLSMSDNLLSYGRAQGLPAGCAP